MKQIINFWDFNKKENMLAKFHCNPKFPAHLQSKLENENTIELYNLEYTCTKNVYFIEPLIILRRNTKEIHNVILS